MQICKRVYTLLALLLLTSGAIAQVTKLRGRVTDSQTGEPLPFVNVSFVGTTIGTVTDFDGNFFLEARTPGDSLSVSYLGYFPKRVTVKKGVFQELNFSLEPESFSLEAVVVRPGENPAHKILRNIINAPCCL